MDKEQKLDNEIQLEKLEKLLGEKTTIVYSDCPEVFDTMWEGFGVEEGEETTEDIKDALDAVILNYRQTLGLNN